jgi:hypothetical protein
MRSGTLGKFYGKGAMGSPGGRQVVNRGGRSPHVVQKMVTIRDRRGNERAKIRKTDMAAYQGLLMDMTDFKEEKEGQQVSSGDADEGQEVEEVFYLDDAEIELHDHVMAHFGQEDEKM